MSSFDDGLIDLGSPFKGQDKGSSSNNNNSNNSLKSIRFLEEEVDCDDDEGVGGFAGESRSSIGGGSGGSSTFDFLNVNDSNNNDNYDYENEEFTNDGDQLLRSLKEDFLDLSISSSSNNRKHKIGNRRESIALFRDLLLMGKKGE